MEILKGRGFGPPNIFALLNDMEAKGITLSLRNGGVYPYYPSLEIMTDFEPMVKALSKEIVFALSLRAIYQGQRTSDGLRGHP